MAMPMGLVKFIKRNQAARYALAGPIALRRQWLGFRSGPVREMFVNFEQLVISDVDLRVSEFEGVFRIGPQSHLLHRLLTNGFYEPELARLFVKYLEPDRDVIDVGANIGFFSVLAARKLGKGRVLAAEPTNAAHTRLQHNLTTNGVADKVIVFQGLVAEAEGMHTINVVPGREEYASRGDVIHDAVADQKTVTESIIARTMDSLVAEYGLKPALLKVDVEGGELSVFQGAERTLKEHRPVVLSEFSAAMLEANGSSADQILALFERCGYDVRDPHDPLAKPGSGTSQDIIALPRP